MEGEASASLARRAVVEGIGTAFLLATVVGSGIMGERLFGGSAGLTLLANSLATGAGLVALTAAFAPVSGAELNPLVTLTSAALGRRPWREVFPYALAQILGALAGVAVAHTMFGDPLFGASHRIRAGTPQMLGEGVATFGLLAVIFLPPRRSSTAVALAVGSYIGAAYWFTSSTAFANPAVTLARSMTDIFTGIRPAEVPGFWAGQAAGTVGFLLLARWLFTRSQAKEESEGFAGATVFRGVAGFGARSVLHTTHILRLSEDLPVVIEVVDSQERVDTLIPILDEMVAEGLVTLEKARVLKYSGGKRPIPAS